ncbi:MAG: thioredoxin family protein, partial [Pseudomonadota bacterium]
ITLWALRYRHLLGRLVTMGCAAFILIIFVFEAKQISNPQTLADPMKRQDGEVTQDRLTSRAYTKENLESLLATGEPVFAYFTADWCVTCKVNERVALHQQETADFFAAEGVKVMVGDWTQHDPEITSILAQYERAGVPMYLYYPPGAAFDEGVLLPQILTPGIVKSEIKAVSS